MVVLGQYKSLNQCHFNEAKADCKILSETYPDQWTGQISIPTSSGSMEIPIKYQRENRPNHIEVDMTQGVSLR